MRAVDPPYFLKLVRHNMFLQSLITLRSFSNLNFKNLEYSIVTNSSIEFYNFPLSETEIFENVFFMITEDFQKPGETVMHLSLQTNESRYFDDTKFYFNEDVTLPVKRHPLIEQERLTKKKLGFFRVYDPPVPEAKVTVMKNPEYGHAILLQFYSNYLEVKNNLAAFEKAISESMKKKESS